MEDEYLKNLAEEMQKRLQEKQALHQTNVVDSPQYKSEKQYLSAYTWDMAHAVRAIAVYSTRASDLYENFLTVKATDDLLQSILTIRDLLLNGTHNMAKREIRYMLEMCAKYVVADQEMSGKPIREKTAYLQTSIPNSSIEVVDRLKTPFNAQGQKEFHDEITDVFYKACAYVHPSKKQIEEQLDNYHKGITVGFETAKMLADMNKLVFRAYDIILVILLVGFGQAMAGDLFIEVWDDLPKWKMHKGKYVSWFSALFDYKMERQNKIK